MEKAVKVHRCCFRWDIYNPFTSWQKLQTTFHHGSPTITQWKATLQPMDRGTSYWNFAFCLEFDEWFKHRYDIPADAVLVVIELDGKPIRRKEVRPCYFCKVNWYTYYLPASAVMHFQMKPHHLVIKIEISLPGRDVGNGLYFLQADLRWLSRDLKKLLCEQKDSNMMLQSKNHTEPIKVHSYMIDLRWNNFFTENALEAAPSEPPQVQPTQEDAKPEESTPPVPIEIDISHGLLMDILFYIYSGILSINWPNWKNSDSKNAAYVAELFHVINQYRMYDLHKAFVNDLQKERVTRNHAVIESRRFRLNSVNDRPIKDSLHPWHINPNSDCELLFTVRVSKDNHDIPWLSYSLQSNSLSRVHVQVKLEVVKEMMGNAFVKLGNRDLLFHGKDYSLDTNATVNSNPVLFLGCPEICGDIDSTLPEGTEIQYSIRCFLNITDGTTANQFYGVHTDTSQSDLERLSILSNDMYKLKMRKEYIDYKIKSRFIRDKGVYLYCLHKGILEARVPKLNMAFWDKVIDFPEVKQLSHKTISFVLDYIYTGKVFPIPKSLFDDAVFFARNTKCLSLEDLMGRIRLLKLTS